MSEKRYFENPFADYDGKEVLLTSDNQILPNHSIKIQGFLSEQTEYLHEVVQKKLYDNRDASVYTGFSGLLLLFLKTENNLTADVKPLLLDAFNNHLRKKRISFLCGDAGPLSICICNYINDFNRTPESLYQQLLQLQSLLNEEQSPFELLYGASGYLFALLYVKCQTEDKLVDCTVIKKVVEYIIASGLKPPKDCVKNLPLTYSWHGKQYIGPAHGYMGILYMVLQAKVLCPESVNESQLQIIVCCLDGLLDQCFPSGNMRSSYGSNSDRLVQWCHGATGAIHTFALAYKITRKEVYLTACRRFADVVWQRGLLTKGYGLCHGAAGNGYTFLCMFQLTRNEMYLWRAIKFAEWCTDGDKHNCRRPDRPFSLFEGLAGTLYYLHDVLKPLSAKFPAFQLVTYDVKTEG